MARSNADLQRVIDQIVGYEGIVRASTIIALAEQIPYRVLPLVAAAAEVAAISASTRTNRAHRRLIARDVATVSAWRPGAGPA